MACGTATGFGSSARPGCCCARNANERQDVIEQMAFTEVRIGAGCGSVAPEASWSTEGWRIDKVEKKSVDLPWSFAIPEGFRQLSAVIRRIAGGNGRDTVQAVYSDGLATFSGLSSSPTRWRRVKRCEVQGSHKRLCPSPWRHHDHRGG